MIVEKNSMQTRQLQWKAIHDYKKLVELKPPSIKNIFQLYVRTLLG
jgi:hypothetical protein